MGDSALDELDGTALTEAEHAFAERLRELFARVAARTPEKGVRTLLRRARKTIHRTGRPERDVLEEDYQAALRRTELRLETAARSSCRVR